MGFTHYWTRTLPVNPEKWAELNRITTEIVRLVEGKKTTTAGGYYSDKPVKLARRKGKNTFAGDIFTNNAEKIAFNGIGELSHETFYLPGPESNDADAWSFCKTARKPYDVVVVAVLTAANSLGILTWSSDGDPADHVDGIKLYTEAKYGKAPEIVKPSTDYVDDLCKVVQDWINTNVPAKFPQMPYARQWVLEETIKKLEKSV
jgi:hypothetical protein